MSRGAIPLRVSINLSASEEDSSTVPCLKKTRAHQTYVNLSVTVDENLPLGPRADGTYVRRQRLNVDALCTGDDLGYAHLKVVRGARRHLSIASRVFSASTCTGGDDNGVLNGTVGDSPLWDTCYELDFAGLSRLAGADHR